MADPGRRLEGAELLVARADDPAQRRKAHEQVEREDRDDDAQELRAAATPW